MRALTTWIDRHLRGRLDLVELGDGADCMFRVKPIPAPRPLPVPGGTIEPGTPILELHFWNENVPLITSGGPGVKWGARAARMLVHTFHVIADALETRPDFASAKAVGGATAIVFPGAVGAEKLLERLGFEVTVYRHPKGRWAGFWENVHTWMIMWTFNPESLQGRAPHQLEKSECWMTREQFLERYGSSARRRRQGGSRTSAS
jgi:hypothetical protein